MQLNMNCKEDPINRNQNKANKNAKRLKSKLFVRNKINSYMYKADKQRWDGA